VSALAAAFNARLPGFTLKPTRMFWAFVTVVPVLGVAALNTGNNALYLLLALVLGAFVASGYCSRHTLRNLRVDLAAPGEVFAGAAVALRLAVRNESRWLPAAGVVCRLVGLPGAVLAPVVPPRQSVTATFTTVFPRRGRVALPAVKVEVRLPLSFFVKAVRWPQVGEALVFPRRVRAGAPRWSALRRNHETVWGGRDRRGADVQQLREFRAGDDRRDIHWKQTARQQRFIVMERRERLRGSRYLVLDREVAHAADALVQQRFDDLVSEVASTVLDRLHRGDAVGLVVGSLVTPPGTGTPHARQLLERLALVEAVAPGADPLPPVLAPEAVYRLVAG
jgi:uncharacterized protein (DUF58 family)